MNVEILNRNNKPYLTRHLHVLIAIPLLSYHAPRKISIELENWSSNVVISKKSYEINPYRETGAFVTHFL